jgi:hypothetical protein
MKFIEGFNYKKNALATSILWFVSIYLTSYLLLFASMGIDFTDEGLYLLEAGGMNTNAVWAVPYGKVLRPLFFISDYNIGFYRALSFSILAFLHILIFREVLSLSQNKIQNINTSMIFGAILLLVSFLFFNGLFIRTPGYNYVNYLSIVLFVYGVVRLKNATSQEHYHNELIILLSMAISTTAKPTTTIVMLLALAVLHFSRYIKFRIKPVNSYTFVGILGALLIIYAFYPAWIYMYKFIFLDKEHQIVFLDSQKFSAGLIYPFLGYFKGLLASDLYRIKLVYVLTALMFLTLIIKHFFKKIPIHKIIFLALLFTVILITLKKPSALSALLNMAFWMLMIQHFYILRNKIYLPLLILTIPFAYVFGTSNSYLMMATHTFPLLFSICIAYYFKTIGNSKFTQAGLVIFGLCIFAINFQSPYRTANLVGNSKTVAELTHGTNIRIPKETASQVEAIKTALIDNGWTSGNEMLCLNYRWSSTLPYFVGANTGNAAMITIFGYQKSVDVGLTKLRRSGLTKNAWIMYNSKVFDRDENLNSTWRSTDSVEIAKKSASYNYQRDTLLSMFYTMNNINKESYVKVFDNFGYIILKPKNINHTIELI